MCGVLVCERLLVSICQCVYYVDLCVGAYNVLVVVFSLCDMLCMTLCVIACVSIGLG